MENDEFCISIFLDGSRTPGDKIEVLSESVLADGCPPWIRVRMAGDNRYAVVDDSFTAKDGSRWADFSARGLTEWDDEVEDRDEEGWYYGGSGISDHLVWKDVHLYPDDFYAPSLDRLLEALKHVSFCACCKGNL